MTRRSFLMRRVKAHPTPERDLQKYLIEWRTADLYSHPDRFPRICAEGLFGQPGTISFEVGCSTAEFLCDLANRNPTELFVGTDINLKSLQVAAGEAAQLGLENIRFIKAPMQWLYPLLAPNSMAAVYIHFPDPALHPKYRKRRLLDERFLNGIYPALAPGGTLNFVTDNATLFGIILALVEADPRFCKTHAERSLVGYEPAVKSRYQQYWEKLGVPIQRVELVKPAD